MYNTPEYRTWRSIINRCNNIKYSGYKDYGGRGIKVCDEWIKSFKSFYSHIGPKPSMDHSIDRINNSGNYEPGNVRWATEAEQRKNQRNVRLFTIDKETLCLTDWAKRYKISYNALYFRIIHGLNIKEALEPTRRPWGYLKRRLIDSNQISNN